jgi:hypothetical protein
MRTLTVHKAYGRPWVSSSVSEEGDTRSSDTSPLVFCLLVPTLLGVGLYSILGVLINLGNKTSD